MAKFNLEDYETVEERLKKFWADYPNGRIYTEVVHITDDGLTVTIRTLGYRDMEDVNPVSTGIAQETKGQGGFANADAWMENCETSSIGRMLANWMYQGSDKARPSREEMSKSFKQPEPKPTEMTVAEVDTLATNMVKGLTPAHQGKALKLADQYAELKKFGINRNQWSKEQIDAYLQQVELGMTEELKPADTVDEAINSVFETEEITEKIKDTIQADTVPRTDLTCPFCSGKVFDNRQDKRGPSSPDFKCGAKSQMECSAHTGKFSKSWWITDDLPKEWNIAPF